MPYRITPFINGGFYHIYNRGVEKRQIYSEERDYKRFFQTLYYYQFNGPKPRFSNLYRFKKVDFNKNPKIIEILCYCLMPNHFHLLIRQLNDGGIQEFLSKISNSYTKYFNTKHRRIGALFQGQFKAVTIETEEQLLHLSRYIHLNPYVAGITKDWKHFPYSSIKEFTGGAISPICETRNILNSFKDLDEYESFVTDHTDYAIELERIKHQIIDVDD